MPRFADPVEDVRATIRLFDRGRYELNITKATPFVREKDNGDISAGVRYDLTMVGLVKSDGELDDTLKDEQVSSFSAYVHSEGGMRMGKQFLMAASGYDDEEEFNNDFGGDEERFALEGEPDEEVTCGPGWFEPVGKRILMMLDKQSSEEYGDRQQFKSFLPVV